MQRAERAAGDGVVVVSNGYNENGGGLFCLDAEDQRIERDIEFAEPTAITSHARCDVDRRMLCNRPLELGERSVASLCR